MHITLCNGDQVLRQHSSAFSHEESSAAALESLFGTYARNAVFSLRIHFAINVEINSSVVVSMLADEPRWLVRVS